MSSPSDWVQFYRQNLSTNSGTMFNDQVSEAIVVTTTATVSTTNSSGHLSPDGRAPKPIRRRSRASRRTPTTLLNTDTTNFRAMVQQFTGCPSAPFALEPSRLNVNPASMSFGVPQGQVLQASHPNNPQALVPGGYNYVNSFEYQQQYHHQPQLGQPQFMFSLRGNMNAPTSTSIEVSDGFGGVSSQVMPPSAPPGSSSNENRSTTFLF